MVLQANLIRIYLLEILQAQFYQTHLPYLLEEVIQVSVLEVRHHSRRISFLNKVKLAHSLNQFIRQ